MTVDLMSITLHFIDNVHFVGAAYKHLEVVQRWGLDKVNWRHTIMALTRVSPTTTKEPGCWATAEETANPRAAIKEGMNMRKKKGSQERE
jgi:hypothetical protein